MIRGLVVFEGIKKDDSVRLKGVAIMLVVLCHVADAFLENVRYFTPLGGIGVAIFLILSGYGLNESWKRSNGKKYWINRLKGLIFPYFWVQTCFYWPSHRFNIIDYTLDVLCIRPAYGFGWFVRFILVIYVFFFVIMKIELLRKNKMKLLAIFSFIILIFADELWAEQAFSFTVGVFLSEISKEKNSDNTAFFLLGVIMILFGGVFLVIKQMPFVRQFEPSIFFSIIQMFIKLPSAMGIIFVLNYIFSRYRLKVLYGLGLISYEIYLVHGYVLWSSNYDVLGLIKFVFCTLAIATVLHYVLDFLGKRVSRVK